MQSFRCGQRLGARDHLVHWNKPRLRPKWMTAAQYEALPDTLAVREVEIDGRVLNAHPRTLTPFDGLELPCLGD